MLTKFNEKKIKKIFLVNKILDCVFHEKKNRQSIDFENIKEILIIDYALIGDSVMSIPLLKILKMNAPLAKITLVCSKLEKAILQDQRLVDDFVIMDLAIMEKFKTPIVNRKYLRALTKNINQKKYDVAIEPRGDLRFIYLMHLCHASRKVSYTYTGGECFLTDAIKPSDNVKHLVEDKIYLLKKIGCRFEREQIYPSMQLSSADCEKNKEFLSQNDLMGRKVIGIHPGASLPIRNWKHYPELLIELHKMIPNVAFLIFEGPKEEKIVDDVMSVAKSCGVHAIRIKENMSNYIRLMAVCNSVVCNDSGAAHLAAALGCEVYVIFGPGVPGEVRPYRETGVHCFSADLECKPCRSRVCENEGACLEKVVVNDICNSYLECNKTNVKNLICAKD